MSNIKKGSQQQDAKVKFLIPSGSLEPYQIAIVEIDNTEGRILSRRYGYRCS